MSDPIVAEELALCERVRASLERRPQVAAPTEAPIVRDLERLREQLVSRAESKAAMALQGTGKRRGKMEGKQL